MFSNRLGIRLLGPKPQWARRNGGEAGLHPSNIHDCEYAIGAINFSGDTPIILAQDGPSLGGFVCPVTYHDQTDNGPQITVRMAGDQYILIEYGPLVLDLDLRFRVHVLINGSRPATLLA